MKNRITLTIVALVATLAAAAVAIAQTSAAPTLEATLKVTPAQNTGTKKKPKNGLLDVVFKVNAESNSTLKRIEYTVPKNIKVDGTGFKTCTSDFINANGDDECVKGSKVGTGAATALLGPSKTPLNFDVEVYAAGPKALSLYLQTSLFNIAIPATISGQMISFDLPERVQQPVQGLYSFVTSVTAKLGKQSGVPASVTTGSGKKKKTRYFVSVQGCPSGGFTGGVKAFLADNPAPPQAPSIEDTATSACQK